MFHTTAATYTHYIRRNVVSYDQPVRVRTVPNAARRNL